MKIITSVREMQAQALNWRCQGLSVGFAPTMGFLHAGHMSLYARSKQENDVTVGSVFVNPIQFGPNEDFAAYPRDEAKDIALCEANGLDCLFLPPAEEMYPEHFATYVQVEGLDKHLCGAQRPGHFRGVTTVVLKLFNICQPTRAYFGQKDIQQLLILRKMVRELNLPLTIEAVPIAREADGLAISSRNVYLSEEERRQAPAIYGALQTAQQLIDSGEKDSQTLIDVAEEYLARALPVGRIDYLQVVDQEFLQPLAQLDRPWIMAVAVRLPHARLIDNICSGL